MTTKIKNPLYPPGVRKMRPTKKHRPALWECMLGTVYASNGTEGRYFDYRYEAAYKFAGIGTAKDPRLYPVRRRISYTEEGREPRFGQTVLWILE